MDNKLSRISNIDREKLDECHYFKSILEEASYLNMLTEEELMLIQMQVIELTDEVVGRYIGIDNSSIRTEEAEQIFESISYAISVCLKTYELPDDALSVLKEKTLKQVYQDGKKRIRGMLNVIKMMYERVKKNTLNIQNIFYLDTIFGGIPGFLKIYDAEFNAQDMKITADYPIYNNLIGKLEGVEFIKEYIN